MVAEYPRLDSRGLVVQVLAVLLALRCCAVSGQGDQWSGLVNGFGALLDFTCPNRTVITGIASDFE